MSPLFLLRWSLRDLRRRWLQVAAIALVIAIGVGLYSALSGTATWRRVSNDASFAATGMYDLRVRSTQGLFAEQGAMLAVLETLPDPSVVAHAEERLVVDTQVDASTAVESIRVPGRIIGLDVTSGGPLLTTVVVADGGGRTLAEADDGARVVVLERNFAEFYGLPPSGVVRLGAGTTLDVVGIGMAPEYFFITTEDGGFFAQANFAALFTTLGTAQQLAGRPGEVNDLVLRLRAGIDLEVARTDVQAAFDASPVGLGVTVMVAEDEDAFRLLYDDIESDRRFWNVFAGLILTGAAFAAFNLASRTVDAQRRELGIGMALGAPPLQLAWRPLLIGVEIGVASVLLGMAVGALAVTLLRPVYTGMLPLPVWITEFQWRPFLRGAGLGFVIPVLATAWPVWRSTRMTPVDAIATVHRTTRSGLARVLRVVPWPRSAFRRMPIGNVLRAPRRTLLTALGIGAAVATLVAVLGMLDSFRSTMDRNDAILLADHPDRVVVGLDAIADENGSLVASVAAADSVGAVSPVLQLAGRLTVPGAEGFDVVMEALDLDGGVWSPIAGAAPSEPGILVAASAADDLGIVVGDEVQLTHPVRAGDGFSTETSTVRVVGIHASPFRFAVYLDRPLLAGFGAQGLANELHVVPAVGSTVDDVERELFDLPGVDSVLPAAATSRIVRDSVDEFTGILRVLEAFMLLLALLIAYNATSINADERRRERATLFAFGLPVHRVLLLEIVECALYGLLGTALGILAGRWIHQWVMTSLLQSTMPDMRLDVVIGGGTVVTALVVGVGAVAAAPLLTLRRLRRMDVPGTLRVVE
ncbi:MAG: ABC transporter permease [Acidimicrobiales bacterium]|jgi:putative ABC transport system permease protein|nr:ABC transporter permease [Acidimicrobiales bacterium]